jgi:hypothetical protein
LISIWSFAWGSLFRSFPPFPDQPNEAQLSLLSIALPQITKSGYFCIFRL